MKTIKEFNSIDSFTTERLLAKKLAPTDIDKLLQMHSDPMVMKTLGGIRTPELTRENLKWNLNQWNDNNFGLWMFYLKDINKWIGRGGLRRIEIECNTEIELNYVLMTAYWGKGYATEIAKSCIEIAFDILRFDSIVSYTESTNKNSIHIMEKVGFQFERNIIHQQLPYDLYRLRNPQKVEISP